MAEGRGGDHAATRADAGAITGDAGGTADSGGIKRAITVTDAGPIPGDIDAPCPGAVTGTVAVILRLEGAATLVAAVAAYVALDGGWLLFAVLFLAPDLSAIAYLAGPRVGARFYNAAHTTLAPFVLAAAGWLLAVPFLMLLAAIGLAHIGWDRMLGYGLKYPSAFGATHLGRKGRRVA